MIMTMTMNMLVIMIMTMTMVSYHHHEAPRAVRGSVGGCSMDMWCPYGIGRESWDREVLRIVCPPFPPRGGDLPSGCVSLRGCRRIGAQEIIVVVVEYIIILIIIIVEPPEFAQLHFCQTVKLESLLFSKTSFSHQEVMARRIGVVVVALFI